MSANNTDPGIILPLLTEDVSVSREQVSRTVRVHVQTAERPFVVNEPVAREKIEIQRVALNRQVDAVPPVREEGNTTIISIVEEVVVVERRLMLKEEIHLRRVTTSERHQETIVLRNQDIVIERFGEGESGRVTNADLAPIPTHQFVKE